ncbi:MAG: amidohydrolase [Caldithrix sp.]|nr:MAG: amidohydrolase [Caldithrix sp.]
MRNLNLKGFSKLKIIDAHTHFFSYTWLEHFCQLAAGQFSNVEALAEKLGWEMPSKDPVELGERWVQEQDKFELKRQVLFASKLNDAEALAPALNAFPDRLIGYFMIDPKQEDARNQAHYSFNILGMRGVMLFPAMHHFHASEEKVHLIYEEALYAEAPVFVHFGQLSIPIFQKLGLPDPVDLKYSNPLDLREAAAEFSDVNFIIPHFGCGRFEEALNVAAEFKNVYFDTSSSNSWIQLPLTLKDVFKKSLQVLGPERLLFGTDSSFFPRGWRKDIFDQQVQVLDSLGVRKRDKKLIFAGNIARLLGLK